MAVARHVYARALFEAAQERNGLDEVRGQLGDFVAAVDEVPELDALLRNPQIDPRAKAETLAEVLKDANELLRNFVLLVVEKGRAGEIREIHREFERQIAELERRLTVELTTAHELSDAEAREIVKQIEQVSGRSVDATRTVDPELIGGIVLQAGSLRLDGSMRGRLERLRRELTTTR